MLKILKYIGWIFAWPFVAIWLLIEINSCKVAGRRYKKDPTSSLQEERYEKVKKLVNHFLYWKRISIKSVGKEKLEKKPMLFIVNHKSNVDPLIVFKEVLDQGCPNITFVAKKELENTTIGRIADLLDVVYIDRQNIRELPNVINEMIQTLKQKTSICLFPEGTRVAGDDFGEFHPTLLEAAYRTHVSIQPTVLYNNDQLLETKFKKDREVQISFLPAINSSKFVNIEKSNFCKKIETEMFENYKKLKANKLNSKDGK